MSYNTKLLLKIVYARSSFVKLSEKQVLKSALFP